MDLKYHIITIMTVFISLGIGILIGSTMGGNELIIKQQQQLITDLEHKLTQLKDRSNDFKHQVDDLKSRLASNTRFQKRILPLVIQNQLQGTKLLIVVGDNIKQEASNKVVQVLELAGVDKIKLVTDKSNSTAKFNKVLLLGKVNEKLKKQYNKQGNTISIKSSQLTTISDLIKVVFRLSSDNLQQLRSEDVGQDGFSFDSGL